MQRAVAEEFPQANGTELIFVLLKDCIIAIFLSVSAFAFACIHALCFFARFVL
jgi:hypothetical protein